MNIDLRDFLGSVSAIQGPGIQIGWPDEPTPLGIADPNRLAKTLDSALLAFRDLRGGADYLVSAEVNAHHQSIWVRFVQRGGCDDRKGQVEPALESAFQSLHSVALQNGGALHYWGGNNYFDLSLPFSIDGREEFPEVKHLPWDERYRLLLERATWVSLRGMVFRFSDLAESIAAHCAALRKSTVLIPSVGLCVHPWLFADYGLSVVTTEGAGSALEALSKPENWPKLYSWEAFERWDIAMSALYATHDNPDHFTRMPHLERVEVRESLRERITFVLSDWAHLPLESGSVDAIFATNALPRESDSEIVRVLKEWGRVVKRGGIVFIAQHNFFNPNVESIILEHGWNKANLLGGESPAQSETTAFQVYHSSG